MNIRFASQNDTDNLKDIWLKCFSDSREFVDWNFEKNYMPENVMLCETDGELAAALHLIPYTISCNNSPICGTYISAVATYEKFRKKGYASALISASLEHLKQNGTDIAFLVPAIEGFYEKFGFYKISEKKEEIFLPENNSSLLSPKFLSADNDLSETVRKIYLKANEGKNLYLKRSLRNTSLICEDLLKNTHGKLKILSDESGYIMFREQENHIDLFEYFSLSEESEKSLSDYLSSLNKDIKYVLPPLMIKFLNTDLNPFSVKKGTSYFNLIL